MLLREYWSSSVVIILLFTHSNHCLCITLFLEIPCQSHRSQKSQGWKCFIGFFGQTGNVICDFTTCQKGSHQTESGIGRLICDKTTSKWNKDIHRFKCKMDNDVFIGFVTSIVIIVLIAAFTPTRKKIMLSILKPFWKKVEVNIIIPLKGKLATMFDGQWYPGTLASDSED